MSEEAKMSSKKNPTISQICLRFLVFLFVIVSAIAAYYLLVDILTVKQLAISIGMSAVGGLMIGNIIVFGP